MSTSLPHYPGLLVDALPILPILFSERPRSAHADSARIASRLQPPPQVYGSIPSLRRCLLLVNHYGRPGFPSWWLGVSVSSIIPREIHWVMTSVWRFERGWRARVLTPLTRWFFQRIAQVYNFTTMPPMPPRPEEMLARTASIRHLLRAVETRPEIFVGLAPEGDDCEQRVLGTPPPGAGRLIQLLTSRGLIPVPVGIYEQAGALHIRFGEPIQLLPSRNPGQQDDGWMINTVMRAIASCLPEELRGKYA